MNDYSTILLNLLKRKFTEFKKTGKEHTMRCRFCGDSSKNNASSHFYIKIKENEVPLYHCFKCNRSGILTPAIIKSMIGVENITEQDIHDLSILDKYLSSMINLSRLHKGYNRLIRNTEWVLPTDKVPFLNEKLKYINARIGLNLSVQEAQNLKIVFSIKDLLFANNLSPNRNEYIINKLDNYGIGFLSIDNGFLTIRNINASKNMRYNNYSLYNDSGKAHLRYYCIPTKVDKSSTKPIEVHIAEGCFDILSIFYNLRNKNSDNNIYICSNGKGYGTVLKLLMEKFSLYNIIVHIYADNDVDDNEIKWYLRKIISLGIKVIMHRNVYAGEKDFGVTKDHIIERIYSLTSHET